MRGHRFTQSRAKCHVHKMRSSLLGLSIFSDFCVVHRTGVPFHTGQTGSLPRLRRWPRPVARRIFSASCFGLTTRSTHDPVVSGTRPPPAIASSWPSRCLSCRRCCWRALSSKATGSMCGARAPFASKTRYQNTPKPQVVHMNTAAHPGEQTQFVYGLRHNPE